MANASGLDAVLSGVDLQLARGDALVARATALKSTPNSAKAVAAAREFESILLTQWLEQARQSLAGAPGGSEDEDDADPGGGQLISMGMQSLASAVTKAGGIGVARMLTRQLEKYGNAENGMAIPTMTSQKEEGIGKNPRSD